MPDDRVDISPEELAFDAMVEAVVFPAKGRKGWRKTIEYIDAALDAGGGRVPFRSATEWHRRFRGWRAHRNRPVHRIAPMVAVGGARVSGRFRQAKRRTARRTKAGASSDDGGGGGEGPRRPAHRRRTQAAPSARVAS